MNLQYIKQLFFATAMVSFCYSCIDPYEISTVSDRLVLTVDGLISTNPGIHTVRLTYANQYSDRYSGTTITVNNANVRITDQSGCEIHLTEKIHYEQWFCGFNFGWESRQVFIPSGIYETPPGFAVAIGDTYTLSITLENGQRYSSTPQTVIPTPKIDTITIAPYSVPTVNPLIQHTGIEFFTHFSDPAHEVNYYFWKPNNAVYALISQPELYTLPPYHLTCPRCLAPKNCCKTCYNKDLKLGKSFSVQDDWLFDGLKTVLPIIRIGDDGLRFNDRYRVQIDQYAINEDCYKFLKLVKQQLESTGSIFDPPPANIRGNIFNPDNEDEQALGYFIVADVSSKVVYVDRSDLPLSYRRPQAIIPDDCRNYCESREPIDITPPHDWKFN